MDLNQWVFGVAPVGFAVGLLLSRSNPAAGPR